MNIKKKTLFGTTLSLTVLAVVLFAVTTMINGFGNIASADGTYSTTITSEMLSSTALETTSWTFSDKTVENEKKFRIDLGNEKYIDGALLYTDCGYQSVGSNLRNDFSIDNSANGTSNNFNFNFYFSVAGIQTVIVQRSQQINKDSYTASGNSYLTSIKYFAGNNLENFFKNHTHGQCKSINGVQQTGSYWNGTISSTSYKTVTSESLDKKPSGCGIFSYQVQGTGLSAGLALNFALKYITITYTC